MSDDAILLAQIDARMNRLDAALNKAVGASNTSARRIERRFQTMNANLDRGFQRLQRAGMAALGAIGVGLSVRGMVDLTNRTLQMAETMQDAADRVGVTVEQLQVLRHGADQTGASAETMDMALQRFARRTGEAAQGTGVLRDVLQRYNIDIRNANGGMRDSYSILMDYADAISNAESNQEALLLANKAFDTEGTRLVGLFRRGSEGVREWGESLRAAGGILGNDLVRQGADANAELRRMQQLIQTQVSGAILANTSELLQMAQALGTVAAKAIEAGAALARALNLGRGQAGRDANDAAATIDEVAALVIERQSGRRTNRRINRSSEEAALLRRAVGTQDGSELADAFREAAEEGGEALIEFANRLYGVSADLRSEARQVAVLGTTITPPGRRDGGGAGQTDIEAERGRALAVTRQQLALQLQLAEAQARGDSDAAGRAQRELDTLSRIETYRRAQISDAEAIARADQARLHGLEDDARAQERANQLIEARLELSARQLEIDLALARARGDQGLVRSLERELEIRTRIAQLTSAGFSTGEATDIATGEADAMRAAIDQGQFRDAFRTAFRDGLLGALDGNAKEVFSNWMRDAATRGLSRALDALADQFLGLLTGSGGGGGILSSIGRIFGFGGGRATGGGVRPGMSYAVGERGREIFRPSVPGTIIPAGQAAGLTSRSGPQEIRLRLDINEGEMFASRVEVIATPIANRAGHRAGLGAVRSYAAHAARQQINAQMNGG